MDKCGTQSPKLCGDTFPLKAKKVIHLYYITILLIENNSNRSSISGFPQFKGRLQTKQNKKRMDLSNAHLTPASQADHWIKKSNITHFYYVFIIFIITKFGENFEEKIDICFF